MPSRRSGGGPRKRGTRRDDPQASEICILYLNARDGDDATRVTSADDARVGAPRCGRKSSRVDSRAAWREDRTPSLSLFPLGCAMTAQSYQQPPRPRAPGRPPPPRTTKPRATTNHRAGASPPTTGRTAGPNTAARRRRGYLGERAHVCASWPGTHTCAVRREETRRCFLLWSCMGPTKKAGSHERSAVTPLSNARNTQKTVRFLFFFFKNTRGNGAKTEHHGTCLLLAEAGECEEPTAGADQPTTSPTPHTKFFEEKVRLANIVTSLQDAIQSESVTRKKPRRNELFLCFRKRHGKTRTG